ncbi:MAG: hypothetical protein K0Q49_766 [Haloplasmataceae bacterium]|jgi:diguanylate cyclase (GGDEF)-like protein|nr:hypothetical protein [Haloplasmataceae bacterium]
MGKFSKQGTSGLVRFLKRNYQNYEENLMNVIELSSKGFYFINENKMYFSSVASKIFNIDGDVAFDEFMERININDRKQFESVDSTYEVTYRYNISQDKILWIKEHGLFDFKNKNQRLAVISNYTNQVEQDKLLHRLAYYDSVTNLKNRNYFEKDANFLIQYTIPFALFFIDLNSFKLINDNFGHSLGDLVLKRFSEKLRACITYNHEFDIYRISGDEFFILFPYLENNEETIEIINKIISTFNEYLIIEDYKLIISPSIGIAYYPKDTDNLQTLIKYADISMYRAKYSEYHSYSFFDNAFYNEVLEEESIEEQIKYLIENQLLHLSYQPIYNLTLNKVVSFETLFNSKSKYSPEKIFTTALKSHLIVLLDKYIIETVIKNISEIELPDDIRFTINVTPKTFLFEDIYEFIKNLLIKYQVDGKRLGIEMTEQYFVNDENKINVIITNLQSLGIQIYLDDFGMGFSSIRNLMYLSYNHIKLDRRMISSIFINKKCESFLKNIIKFSQDIDCEVIFEGVETASELEYVKSIGGIYVQGFYFSKPVPISEALKLLKL